MSLSVIHVGEHYFRKSHVLVSLVAVVCSPTPLRGRHNEHLRVHTSAHGDYVRIYRYRYIDVCIHICICIYVYIYTHIHVERERERDKYIYAYTYVHV